MSDNPDPLIVEGLAGQLYASQGIHFVWWHLLKEDVKVIWRKNAIKRIQDFNRHYPRRTD